MVISSLANRIAPKLLAEFIGTFSFVFIGAGTAAVVGGAVGLNGIAAVAFAHGLAIMVFAFAYGSVSGAHFNPAVTVGVLAAGAMGVGEAIGYIVSHFALAVDIDAAGDACGPAAPTPDSNPDGHGALLARDRSVPIG